MYLDWVDNGTWPAQLAAALATGQVSLPNRAEISADVLERLLPNRWLNDEVINFFMWQLQQRDASLQRGLQSAEGHVSCHFFSSFFMAKLHLDKPQLGQINYSAVRRWSTARNLQLAGQARHSSGVLSCSLLVAPCNLGNSHWVLVVADLCRRRIIYLDPAGVSKRHWTSSEVIPWCR